MSTSTQHAPSGTVDVDPLARCRRRGRLARPAPRWPAPLFTRAVADLPLRVQFPDGRLTGGGPPSAPVMILHRPREFFRRVGASGLIGFGESYMAGDWDCADLTGLLTVFATHVGTLVPPWLQRMRALAVRRPPADDRQTRHRRPAEHRPPLRPVQRPVRAVPGRDHDLLLGPVRRG